MRPRKEYRLPSGDGFARVLADYRFDGDVFNADDERVRRIKFVMDKYLTEADRRIMIYYAECGSIRDTAARMGVSRATMGNTIQRIRKEICTHLERIR